MVDFTDDGNDLEAIVYKALGAAEVASTDELIKIGEALISKIRETHQSQGDLQYKIHRQKKMLAALEKSRDIEVLDTGWYEVDAVADYHPTRIRWGQQEWIRLKAYEWYTQNHENQAKKLGEAYQTINTLRVQLRDYQDENKKLRLLLKGRPAAQPNVAEHYCRHGRPECECGGKQV